MYIDHKDQPTTGLCRICGERKCDDYRFAMMMLISAAKRLPDA
jgi:hypothetical protein